MYVGNNTGIGADLLWLVAVYLRQRA
jgi:hypothetical protein